MIRMKHILNFGRPDRWKPGAGILCVILALVAGGGCGKSKNAATPVQSPPAADSAATPSGTPLSPQMQPTLPAVSVNAVNVGQKGPTQVQSLNRAMMGWVMKNHRRPQTFEEFASTAGFQIPDPPAGKKYALNSKGFIILVNSNQ
jgi:hypothetical protein